MKARVATLADLDGVTETLWKAFVEDPLWRWSFPDQEKLVPWWHFLVESALRYPWVWVTGDFAAASVWIPPDGTELTADEEKLVEPLLCQLVGARCPDVLKLLERFDASQRAALLPQPAWHPSELPGPGPGHGLAGPKPRADRCRGSGGVPRLEQPGKRQTL